MNTQNHLWVRSFTRSEGFDHDSIADGSLLKLLSNDLFGWFLQQGQHLDVITLNDLISIFFSLWTAYQIAVYCVADGAFIPRPKAPAFAEWYNPHVRFLTVVEPQESQWAGARLFIVGSGDVNNPARFLQVASWDTKVFRFYGIESINGNDKDRAWTYQGTSADAFGTNEYLGPFNGHINGAMIMKELHKPWYHWYSNDDPNLPQCFSPDEKATFKSTPWLTGPGQPLFKGGNVSTADNLEPAIQNTVSSWFVQRLQNDLVDSSGNNTTPKKQPENIPRWIAHFLLTTTINIATSTFDGRVYTAPLDHFFNNELLSVYNGGALFPDPLPDLSFDYKQYKDARNEIELSLLQEVDPQKVPDLPPEIPTVTLRNGTLGGGKQTNERDVTTFIVTAPKAEGSPFVIVQSSFEDTEGIDKIQNIGLGPGFPQSLLSEKAFNALTMIDFCNPVYSWRRGVLFQYVPSNTSLTAAGYDFEANFVSAIKGSPYSSDFSSPEFQFLAFYNSEQQANDYRKIITDYMKVVSKQIKTEKGLSQHLKLAESRRRLYRPLPLDEFGFTLPYAVGVPINAPFLEMTPNGTIQPIPHRGLSFLVSWTGTLWTYDPKLLPQFEGESVKPLLANQSDTVSAAKRAVQRSGCPAMRKHASGCPAARSRGFGHLHKRDLNATNSSQPTWDDQVGALFSDPYWIPNGKSVGSHWRDAMLYWSPPTPERLSIDLAKPSSVENNAVTIYQHLRSKSMPVTSDPKELWPEEALKTFRLWVNQGFRRKSTDPIIAKVIIPPPVDPPAVLRVRKDLLSLTEDELQTYRAKVDDILQVGSLGSKWQELGIIHAEWCLHYQEAFLFWHRAYLRYVEELIDFPIPYWNGFASDTSNSTSNYAGLPSVFLDETYVHPNGQTRPNPLRYALSLNGTNKMGTGKYIERAQVLIDGPKNPAWSSKIALFDTYHQQIKLALKQPFYSIAQHILPWANLPAFTDHQPDSDYPRGAKVNYFDGHFEQPHDNYHGWIGPDMADNSYTAFDPIFLSYHANMDRIFEMYLRAKPTQSLTTNYPLQPWIDFGRDRAYSDPRPYLYSTIGDMAKDTKALQYMYAPSVLPDYFNLSRDWAGVQPTGGTAVLYATNDTTMAESNMTTASIAVMKRDLSSLTNQHQSNLISASKKPHILFSKISCITASSFYIDVFVAGAASHMADPALNPDFIGRMTRLGMGPHQGRNNTKRCNHPPVTRVMDASRVTDQLKKAAGGEGGAGGGIVQVVTDVFSGQEIAREEWKGWDGFVGRLVWLPVV